MGVARHRLARGPRNLSALAGFHGRNAGRGLLDPAYTGKPLPFVERVELRVDKEDIPAFTKFLQGYYDASGIIEESFDRIVKPGGLSPDMAALGMRLDKSVTPAVYYLGFNMDDAIVGAPAGERGRKLRQAMSLAIDAREFTRLFINGRGIPAQSPLPPGIFGYDPAYANPYRV
ncbi:MAG: ABC transporter substrate-binding protein, partial [Aestuariivirga sp.]